MIGLAQAGEAGQTICFQFIAGGPVGPKTRFIHNADQCRNRWAIGQVGQRRRHDFAGVTGIAIGNGKTERRCVFGARGEGWVAVVENRGIMFVGRSSNVLMRFLV